jgi:hypothetical protein
MKMNREELKELIREVMNLNELSGDEMEQKEPDMNQAYIDYIVAVHEAAREAIEEIERGAEPYEAAFQSRFNQLVRGFTGEDFYHFFFS